MTTVLLAMDRASVRRRDVNGYLHVEVSNISKANVCPYYGREIPDANALGLKPDQVYQLYRDPDELASGAASFNNVPLLSQHVAVVPEDGLPEELIIGSTGTDAHMEGAYLRNSLVVWSAPFQDAIERGEQRELSCGYRYRADMTPGTTEEGLRYDGVMREIMGNHVALVIEGRAGPDVIVGDEVMKLKSRTALMISGAIQSHVRPLLAADAKVDLTSVLAGIDGKSFARKGAAAKLAGRVAELVTPHLAADAALDVGSFGGMLAAIQPLGMDEDKIEEEDVTEDEADEDDDGTAKDEDPKARDDDDDDDDDGKKPAMDHATVQRMMNKAREDARRDVLAIEQARRDVQPLVGEVTGMDSAAAIYGFALDAKGYDADALKGAPLATLKAMVSREAALARPKTPLAQDAATTKRANDTFAELYGSK